MMTLAAIELAVSLGLLFMWILPLGEDGNFLNLLTLSYILGNERLYDVSTLHILVLGLAFYLVPMMSLVTTLASATILLFRKKPGARFIRGLTIGVTVLIVWQLFVLLMLVLG